jgi:hypothetical protein
MPSSPCARSDRRRSSRCHSARLPRHDRCQNTLIERVTRRPLARIAGQRAERQRQPLLAPHFRLTRTAAR